MRWERARRQRGESVGWGMDSAQTAGLDDGVVTTRLPTPIGDGDFFFFASINVIITIIIAMDFIVITIITTIDIVIITNRAATDIIINTVIIAMDIIIIVVTIVTAFDIIITLIGISAIIIIQRSAVGRVARGGLRGGGWG